ncbi:M56 family metallopeptidase [Paenibacillus sp. 1_12]|uniref:M56 family metallopeptidase n=1 Tax=Paenibacillus sp. 1_12 TaxID=1566278 RepID=UPI000B83C929|nr:M56 family metallopeptidase [Paenibacillus sp. 1_12]
MSRITEQLIHLFDWVWSVSIMASVLVVLIIVMQRVLKHRLKPRWHYLMWLLVIVRLMLPWGPESEFSIYNWIGYTGSVHSAVQVNPEEMLIQAVPETAETAIQMVYRHVFVIWLVGVCLLGVYTFRVNRRFAQQMDKETVTITDARVIRLFNQCKKMMSIHRSIALVESRSLATPTLLGFVNPQLIMPQTLISSLNDDQLQHVFLHELAHSKRNDIGVNWFMHILLMIHWFNPVLWYAYRRMREDQEIACDALALSCLAPDKSQEYGYTLIKLLENFSQPVQAAGNVNLTGSKVQLQRRIQMIKQFKSNSYRWSFLGMAALLFISGCALTNPKGSQTSEQLPSSTISEEITKQTASVQSNTTASEEKPGTSASVGAQSMASEASPTPTAANEPQPAPSASDDKTRLFASVKEQPTVSDDKPRVAPSVKQPILVEDTPRAAPSVRQPVLAEDTPRPAPSVRQPVLAEDTPKPAPSVRQPVLAEDTSKPAPSVRQPVLAEDTSKLFPAVVQEPSATSVN